MGNIEGFCPLEPGMQEYRELLQAVKILVDKSELCDSSLVYTLDPSVLLINSDLRDCSVATV